jgi:hypothetical protein
MALTPKVPTHIALGEQRPWRLMFRATGGRRFCARSGMVVDEHYPGQRLDIRWDREHR